MSSDIKLIAKMNIKLFSWTLNFRKVVRQHISGEVVILIQASSELSKNKSDLFFSETYGILVQIKDVTGFRLIRKKQHFYVGPTWDTSLGQRCSSESRILWGRKTGTSVAGRIEVGDPKFRQQRLVSWARSSQPPPH